MIYLKINEMSSSEKCNNEPKEYLEYKWQKELIIYKIIIPIK
jgi:hypothetical protein